MIVNPFTMHNEFYRTPKWCFDILLEAWQPPPGLWLDPCAGDGSFQENLKRDDGDYNWVTNDPFFPGRDYSLDFTKETPPPGKFDMVAFNPPFSVASTMLERAMEISPVVLMFVRSTFLGSKERNEWLVNNQPDKMFHIPDRLRNYSPKKKKIGNDNVGRIWMVWDGNPGQSKILRHVPLEIRSRDFVMPIIE